MVRSAHLFEQFGSKMAWLLPAGAVMVEVTKQVHAPSRPGLSEAVRKPLEALGGVAKPVRGRKGLSPKIAQRAHR